jgi:hypothetical protein
MMYFVLIVIIGQDDIRLMPLPLRVLLKEFQSSRTIGTNQQVSRGDFKLLNITSSNETTRALKWTGRLGKRW